MDVNQLYQSKLLEFLDQLLYAAFLFKKDVDFENMSMRGLVITEKEVERAFGIMHRESSLPDDVVKELWKQEREIGQIEKEADETLLFCQLCEDFDLSHLERLALLLAAAPSFDRKYEKIYGYLQDHVDVPEPTRGLCISLAELLGKNDADANADFLAGNGNLEYLIDTSNGKSKGIASVYRLKPRVRDYLHGSMEIAECLRGRLEVFDRADKLENLEIREEYLERLCRLWEQVNADEKEDNDSCMILLHGKGGIGKHFLLRHLAVRKQLIILCMDISGMLHERVEVVLEVLENLFVESILQRAEICLTGTDLVQEVEEDRIQSRQDCRREILDYMKSHLACFFVLSEEKEEQTEDYKGRKICVEVPTLSAGEKIRLWKAYGANYQLDDDVDLEQNGNKYILTPKGIWDALDTAKLIAATEGRQMIVQEDIRQAVKQNQKNQLGAYATLINSRFIWEDLILGEEEKRKMRMVCNQMKYRDVVGENWGFHKKTPYGRGLSVLFYGPPGTGKTMAAQVIANELGLDLYRIDISQMVSKYIGETQKNISGLFQKAKDINAVLFFDEADSLFAKRSEAKDSHDRNANAETAHLLQKLEDYEGITILATNYLNNIDDAFKRRIKFIIHIAFPESNVRLRLWQSTLPAEAQCDEELDLEFFAERFELSGSSIKEILTNAAYLAAAEHRGLKNQDLVEAVKLNYAKYGKILTKSDFEYLG